MTVELPAIAFELVSIAPVEPDRGKWIEHFTNFLRRPQDFQPLLERENQLLGSLIDGLGASASAIKVLEGVAPKVKNVRRWLQLRKMPGAVNAIAAELDADPTARIIVYGVHKLTLTEIREGLRKYGAASIFDGTPDDKRNTYVKQWRNGKLRVLVATCKGASKLGPLDLAHKVRIVETDWDCANNLEAIMRVWRVGQVRPVNVAFFGLRGTVDEEVTKLLKTATRRLVLDYDRFYLR